MTLKEARAVEIGWKKTRALEMAQQLYDLLGELHDLPENGPGSRVAAAWDVTDDVIEILQQDRASAALGFELAEQLAAHRAQRQREQST